MIGLENIDRTMGSSKEITISSSRNNSHLQFIDDTIKELKG
jgi:hypothetical protein